jgi:lipid-A-disaccharide synthase
MIVAGEASGDLHAAGLAAMLKERHPEWRLSGMGGARMVGAGVDVAERTDTTAVMGFVEVLRTLPKHYAMLKAFRRRLESGDVHCLVPIDYPGFNLRLAAAAQRARVPVLYYITPQVWAWGADRLPKMAKVITKAAVILPFEEELLRAHGVDATFVGHPLLDRAREMPDRAKARRSLGLPDDASVLALFPGSRQQEIDRHIDDFVQTAQLLQRAHQGLHVVVATAPGVAIPGDRCPYRQVTESSLAVLRAADAAICKSGTTTLEAAVAGCPLVVAYRTNRWTHAIARRVVRIPRIGLVNVVAGKEIAREFVQSALVPESMARAVSPLLVADSPERHQMIGDLEEVRRRLGSPGASARVADMVASLIP